MDLQISIEETIKQVDSFVYFGEKCLTMQEVHTHTRTHKNKSYNLSY